MRLVENQSNSKAYWKIPSKLINKADIPRIPSILYGNKFVVDCDEKAILFNDFLQQCKPMSNTSTLTEYINYETENDILSTVHAMDPNKWLI